MVSILRNLVRGRYYICTLCTCLIQVILSQMVEVAQESPPIDKERPFACPVCYKTYKRRDHLKLHSLTHMKKDKICSECGRGEFKW